MYFPDLPGCKVNGSDDFEATKKLIQKFYQNMYAKIAKGEQLPAPSEKAEIIRKVKKRDSMLVPFIFDIPGEDEDEYTEDEEYSEEEYSEAEEYEEDEEYTEDEEYEEDEEYTEDEEYEEDEEYAEEEEYGEEYEETEEYYYYDDDEYEYYTEDDEYED
jgi:hypothetical protein